MIQTKDKIYKKAYTELNEVLKFIEISQLEKIPDTIIVNIKENMDKEYNWKYDSSKDIVEQDLMAETKALIVELYERYLCQEDEKEFWIKYDKICLNMIEQNKMELYNSSNIFNKNKIDDSKNTQIIEYKKREPIIKKLINILKKIFNSKK